MPSINGQVRDELTEKVVANAQLSLVGRNEKTSTDSAGNFALPIDEPLPTDRDVQVTISRAGYQQTQLNVHVPREGFIVRLAPLPDIPGNQPKTFDPVEAFSAVHPFDFSKLRPSPPTPGSDCGNDDIIISAQPSVAAPHAEVTLQYDANLLCRGQAYRDLDGYISWGANSAKIESTMGEPHNATIGGAFKMKFSKPGDYPLSASITATCLDVPDKHTTCRAHGDTVVHIR